MGSLESRIDPQRIALDLRASSRDDVLRWAAGVFAETGVVPDPDEPMRQMIERERIGSTAVFPGVAVPHCRCGSSSKVAVALARLGDPVDFVAKDGLPVHLVFAIIGPPEATVEHVRVLGEVAKIVKDEGRRTALLEAPSVDEVIRVVAPNRI